MTKSEILAWIEKEMDEQYQQIKTLRDTPSSRITVWAHRQLGTKIVMRRCPADYLVYRQMLPVIHENLPQILEVQETENGLLVLEEFAEGSTLAEVLAQRRLTAEEVKRVMLALCDALICLHSRDVIHRDVKPENIMLTANGGVKLLDLSAARYCRKHSLNAQDTTILGTVGYAAPEQYGFTPTDPRADIFAVGVLLNVLLTGEHPSKQIAPGRMGRIVRKCTRINPSERYSSVEQVKWRL